jgi:hypothetical protein
MTPKRPASVPDTATLVYPGQSFIPGIGVQFNTLKSMQSQLDHANNNSDLVYARALEDYNTNAPIYAAYHMQGPPQPVPPQHASLKITYADASGNVLTDPNVTGTGLEYAWVEEVYA